MPLAAAKGEPAYDEVEEKVVQHAPRWAEFVAKPFLQYLGVNLGPEVGHDEFWGEALNKAHRRLKMVSRSGATGFGAFRMHASRGPAPWII